MDGGYGWEGMDGEYARERDGTSGDDGIGGDSNGITWRLLW